MGHLKDLEKIKFDTRLKDWNLKRNIISTSDIDQHTNNLPDVSANAQSIEIEDENEASSNGLSDTGLIQPGIL